MMETRAIVDENDRLLATISFPEGTPESVWQRSFEFHVPQEEASSEETLPPKRAWWKFW